MNEDFVTYNQAIQLKELGFDIPVNHYYKDNKLIQVSGYFDNYCNVNDNLVFVIDECYSAPTFAQVQKWFREKHYLSIEVYTSLDIDSNWEWDGFVKNLNDILEDEIEDTAISCQTYEEALSKCIDKAIEILINKKK